MPLLLPVSHLFSTQLLLHNFRDCIFEEDAYRRLGEFLDDVYNYKLNFASFGYLTPAELGSPRQTRHKPESYSNNLNYLLQRQRR